MAHLQFNKEIVRRNARCAKSFRRKRSKPIQAFRTKRGACLANTFSDMPPAYGKQNSRIFTDTGDGAIQVLIALA